MSANDDWHNLWKNLFVQRFVAGKLVRREVKHLSKNFFHRQDLSNVDMEHFVEIVDQLNDEDGDEEMKDDQKLKVIFKLIFQMKWGIHKRLHANLDFF